MAEERGCNLCTFGDCKQSDKSKKDWSEFLYGDKDPNSVPAIIQLIKKYSDDKQYFDIFQICAFDSENNSDAYKTSLLKAILCLVLQIPSLLWIAYYGIINAMPADEEQETTGETAKDLIRIMYHRMNVTMPVFEEDEDTDETPNFLCNLNPEPLLDGIILKLLAFGFCLYVAYWIDDMMQNAGLRGMYCINKYSWKNKPAFLDGHWLRIGVYYNKATQYLAIIASYITIFLQKDPKFLVLGCVGMFFIVELSDQLVTKFDYWRIGKFCKEKMDENAQKSVEANGQKPVEANGQKPVEANDQNQPDEYDPDQKNDGQIQESDDQKQPNGNNQNSESTPHLMLPVGENDEKSEHVGNKSGGASDDPPCAKSDDAPCADCALCYENVVNIIRGCILLLRWFAPFYVGVCA